MKNKTTSAVLALFLGGLGVHRFYLKQPGLGVAYFLFCWTGIPSFIGLIDFIVLLSYSDEKFYFKYNVGSQELTKSKLQSRDQETPSGPYHTYFEDRLIQRQGIQLLESLHIMNSTKNLDTLIGRNDFVKNIYDKFIEASSSQRYLSDAQIAIDEYKTLHYDKILEDFEIELLIKPSKDKQRDYYSECLLKCFERFREEQQEQIKNLKREDAKSRRTDKIQKIGIQTVNEFKEKGSKKDEFMEKFKALEDTFDQSKNIKKAID